MTQASLHFDICANKHGGNAESVAANERVDKATSRERVYRIIRHSAGLTCKEIAAELELPMHCVSGRVAELKLWGKVQPTGERREGGMVVRAC